MRSPFPGMDPYLESPEFWPDFHSTFVNCWREAIAGVLPDGYEARIDERVNLVEIPPSEQWESAIVKRVHLDIAISQQHPASAPTGGVAAVSTVEPVTIPLVMEFEEVRETYIKILHRADRSLITVLELLSPTNKTDIGYGDFMSKQAALLRQRVHLVELDLLVGGTRLMTAVPLPPAHYYAIIARVDRRPDGDVYAWTVRDPLPMIPVPLKAPDQDVLVDLAPVFATAFERGRYAQSLRYGALPHLPLPADELAWCAERAAAVRSTSIASG